MSAVSCMSLVASLWAYLLPYLIKLIYAFLHLLKAPAVQRVKTQHKHAYILTLLEPVALGHTLLLTPNRLINLPGSQWH